MNDYALVLGDDVMGFYVDGKLACAAKKLSFGDILDACRISYDIWELDLDKYDDPLKLPKSFSELSLEEAEKV